MDEKTQDALQTAHFDAALERSKAQSTIYDSEGTQGDGATVETPDYDVTTPSERAEYGS